MCFGGSAPAVTEEVKEAPKVVDPNVEAAGVKAAKDTVNRSTSDGIATSPQGLVNYDPSKLFKPVLGGAGSLGKIGTTAKALGGFSPVIIG